MAQLNANTPYVQCNILREATGLDEDLEGYIFGVKSMLNRPLLFHFQGSNGAVMYNLPISCFTHGEEKEDLGDIGASLKLLETWDCQSNTIAVTAYAFLQYKRVDVFCRDKVWRSGKYLFTIDDYEGDLNEPPVGYAGDRDSKCFHFIELDNGYFCVQPNNLLRWHNPDFIIPYSKDTPPKMKVFSDEVSSEDIDRSYGNSPYFFYAADEAEKKDVLSTKKSGF